jgi:hypothetical protein
MKVQDLLNHLYGEKCSHIWEYIDFLTSNSGQLELIPDDELCTLLAHKAPNSLIDRAKLIDNDGTSSKIKISSPVFFLISG